MHAKKDTKNTDGTASLNNISRDAMFINIPVVYGNTYVFPGTFQMVIPRWYQYCLGIDVPHSLFNFSINGVPAAINMIFHTINSYPTDAQILASKIIVYNKRFGYVNIFSTNLRHTNRSALGNVVAWNITNWSFKQPAGFTVFYHRKLVLILGAKDRTFYLKIQKPLNFISLERLCTRLGPGVSEEGFKLEIMFSKIFCRKRSSTFLECEEIICSAKFV